MRVGARRAEPGQAGRGVLLQQETADEIVDKFRVLELFDIDASFDQLFLLVHRLQRDLQRQAEGEGHHRAEHAVTQNVEG